MQITSLHTPLLNLNSFQEPVHSFDSAAKNALATQNIRQHYRAGGAAVIVQQRNAEELKSLGNRNLGTLNQLTETLSYVDRKLIPLIETAPNFSEAVHYFTPEKWGEYEADMRIHMQPLIGLGLGAAKLNDDAITARQNLNNALAEIDDNTPVSSELNNRFDALNEETGALTRMVPDIASKSINQAKSYLDYLTDLYNNFPEDVKKADTERDPTDNLKEKLKFMRETIREADERFPQEPEPDLSEELRRLHIS